MYFKYLFKCFISIKKKKKYDEAKGYQVENINLLYKRKIKLYKIQELFQNF